MRHVICTFRRSVSLWLTLFVTLLLLVVGHSMPQVSAAEQAQKPGQRIITVYDRGTERVFLTEANTVGEALSRADIELSESDSVEPGLDEQLIASDYRVNIYRARPIVVVDGFVRQKIMTAYQTPSQIAESAGVVLYAEDVASIAPAGDILNDGAGLELTIDRAKLIKFVLYGKVADVRTQAETVGEMLAENDIVLERNDRLSVDKSSPIVKGMKIELWREGKQTITSEEDVDFEIEQIRDADRDIGYREIKSPGKKGKRTVTYEVVIKNGKEESRREIASVTTVYPEKQVEVVGTKRKTGTPDENRQYARNIMGSYGFGDDQWTCLDKLWTHESGWDQYKANYAGSGAYGIPQALPGSKMGPGWESDPAVQINWGLGYIKNRYSTPCGAYSHWQANNWY